MPKSGIFRSQGKLLISAEYLVMDGAKALAIPTKMGQSMEVQKLENKDSIIHWKAYNEDQSLWFETELNYKKLTIAYHSTEAETLLKIFSNVEVQKALHNDDSNYLIQTRLEFPKDWGLGTSSTLINNLAQWLKINPYPLQYEVFGGSGYDIACAQHHQPIFYQRSYNSPKIAITEIQDEIKPYLYFVYLNKKQNSRDAIKQYRKQEVSPSEIEEISTISQQISLTKSLNQFEELIQNHNYIISKILNQSSAQEKFPDAFCTLKYLGAWGGDFMMAASDQDPIAYFHSKGYDTVLKYSELFN